MSEKNQKKIFIESEHPLTQRTEFQQRSHQIIRLDGKDCFVEVMTGQFFKGKVILNFEQYDNNKPKGDRTVARITYFMPFDKFLQLEQDILSGKIAKLAEKEKAINKFPQPVYIDRTGTSAELLKINNQAREDGKSESRQLKIIPGLKAEFMMQAEKGAGEKGSTGIIKPIYGNKPEQKVSIPMSGDDLKKLFSLTKVHIIGYIASQYNIRANEIQKERNGDIDITNSEDISKNIDIINQKLDALNKDIKNISNMIIKIGKIVSENK